MFQFNGAPSLESGEVAIRAEAERVPKANRILNAKLALEGPQRRPRVQGPVTPGRARKTILEEHADDGHHCQAAIRDLSAELLRLLLRVRRGEHLPAVVAWSATLVILEAAAELAEAEVRNDLRPAQGRHLRDRRQAVRDVLELQASGGAQVPRDLASDLRSDVAHGCQHADAAMFQFNGAPSLESGEVAIRAEAERVPKANRILNAKLALEGPQRRPRVQGPVTPGRARKTILEEHADDGHHCQAAIRDLSAELLRLLLRVRRGEHLPAVVAWSATLVILEAAAEL